MKKLTFVVFIMLLMASSAWAAGTVIVQTDKMSMGLSGKQETREITYLVTFGADASSPAATALDSILKANGNRSNTVSGWWIMEISTLYGSTGPTDNTDMYIYRATGTNKIDILGGNGVNAIDNATNNTFHPVTMSRALYGDDILSIANNAINNAIVQIVITMYR
jgi:hypothetical protein